MRLAVYSLLRLGLFAVCLGVLFLVGMRSWLLVVLAALLAWGLSYVLLGRWRDAAANQLAEAAERRKALGGKAELTGKAREEAELEDAADEAARTADPAGAGADPAAPLAADAEPGGDATPSAAGDATAPAGAPEGRPDAPTDRAGAAG